MKRGADLGDGDMQISYSDCFLDGRGVAANITAALEYLKLAADQGNLDAQQRYNDHFAQDPPSRTRSAGTLCRAADNGDPVAQADYGLR
jgi:TPR repeat protein